MPTLFRFVVTLAVLAGIVYGAMLALVMFVEPKQAELSVRIPPERLDPGPKRSLQSPATTASPAATASQ